MLGRGKTTPRFSASSPGEAPLCRARPIRRIALNRTIGSFQASFNPSMNGWGSFSGRVASFAHCGGCLPFSPRCADENAIGPRTRLARILRGTSLHPGCIGKWNALWQQRSLSPFHRPSSPRKGEVKESSSLTARTGCCMQAALGPHCCSFHPRRLRWGNF
jgi:hypothetical protein